jgi:maleate isomerase
MLTPSSNTALEPIAQSMVAGVPGVSVHFSRFRVVEISLTPEALAQFDGDAILPAAQLLADARVDVIAWNGTSSGWLGFDSDERLCTRITAATGIRATTSMLALNEVLRQTAVKRYGLVSPYLDDVQASIIASYNRLGLTCVGDSHLRLKENFAFADVDESMIRRQVADVAAAKPDAIVIICTNLRAAQLVPSLEAEHGIPIYDSIATAMWKSLQIAGVPAGSIQGWGGLFARSARVRSEAMT